MKRIPEFECKKCGDCCRDLAPESIFLFPKDIVAISDRLNMDPKTFIEKYCVINHISVEKMPVELCYLNTNYENCPFLEENLCVIQVCKPTQCKLTPYNFFAYYNIWSYLECISADDYPEGCSNESDIFLIKELLSQGYNFE